MNDETADLSGKELLAALDALRAELHELMENVRPLREQLSQNDKQRARVETEIKKLHELISARRENITVSDHAVIRYLERRHGFDFEAVRDEILTPALRGAVNAGASGVKVDGGTFKIRDRTITTYIRFNKEPD